MVGGSGSRCGRGNDIRRGGKGIGGGDDVGRLYGRGVGQGIGDFCVRIAQQETPQVVCR